MGLRDKSNDQTMIRHLRSNLNSAVINVRLAVSKLKLKNDEIKVLQETVDSLRRSTIRMRTDLLDAQKRIDELNEAGRGFEELCEVLKNQIETYCGDFCEKRPMQEGCEMCPFYDEYRRLLKNG